MRWLFGSILEWMARIRSVRIMPAWIILLKLYSIERSGLLCDTRWNILVGVLRHGSCKCDRDYRGCEWLRIFKPVEGHRERKVTYKTRAGAPAAQDSVALAPDWCLGTKSLFIA
jgi:hypothetical protein